MIRFLLYAVVIYLVYLYFIKPLFRGYRQSDADRGRKEKVRVHTKKKEKNRYNDQGEYIDYEEVK